MINFKNSTLIVSHPDDECLFASSLLNKISTLIICFGDIPKKQKISIGRKKAIKNFPLKNIKVINLDIPQSYESLSPINWYKVFDKKSGIKGGYKNKSYDKNYEILALKLRDIIPDNSCLITHNPWGEYGHGEHCQVFKACFAISKETNSILYVTGYVSKLSKYYANTKTHLLSSEKVQLQTNPKLYNLLKEHYIKYECWTWKKIYKLPRIEFFYKVNLKNNPESKCIKNQYSKITLNYIDHYNPIIYFIGKILKRFLNLIY